MWETKTKSTILQRALRSLNLQPIRLVFRLPILVFLAGTMIVPSARGQSYAKDIAGVYDGRLHCASAQHETNFKLSLTATGDYALTDMLTFDAQDDSGTHAVTYSLKGTNAGAAFQVNPVKWETPKPACHMVMTRSGAYNVNSWFGLNGNYDSSDTISGIDLGIVKNPACTFSAKRSTGGPANIDTRNAALPQDNKQTAPQTMSASRDQTGQHPATASVAGPTHVKCLTAKSDVPNPQPDPGCHVDAPDRVSVDLKVGGSVMFARTGTMTLTCTGPGNLRCTAEVKRAQAH